jgi:lambda repressor-like predicted transcriptional regulator
MKHQSSQEGQARDWRHRQAHVRALRKSGLSRAEYCRQHQLSYHRLTYWEKKLAAPVKKETTLVPVTFSPGIRMTPVAEPAIKIILPNKFAIEVHDNFSTTTLSRLLATLEKS